MAFADFDWATDTNYPAGSETWSATPTKVAPSSGVRADGFAPGDQPPAQWINWLFNSIIVEGQALELRGLQEAWDQSETNGDTTPHIDVGTEDLVIGGTANADLFKVQNSTQGATARNLAVTQDLTVGGESSLSLSGGIFVTGGTATQRLLAHDSSGQVIEYQGASGVWTPAVSGVTGTGVVSGDFTSLTGHYIRLGNVLLFTIELIADTTGWSGACSVEFDPPVGTASGNARGTVTLESPATVDTFALLRFGSGLAINMTPGSSKGPGQGILASGSIALT